MIAVVKPRIFALQAGENPPSTCHEFRSFTGQGITIGYLLSFLWPRRAVVALVAAAGKQNQGSVIHEVDFLQHCADSVHRSAVRLCGRSMPLPSHLRSA